MAAIGHPLVGEGKYSVGKSDKSDGFTRQCLHSWKIYFDIPEDNPLAYLNGKTFEAEPPDWALPYLM
jgi:23S rRNA-/tRNA-specific pseudouridylate synthase